MTASIVCSDMTCEQLRCSHIPPPGCEGRAVCWESLAASCSFLPVPYASCRVMGTRSNETTAWQQTPSTLQGDELYDAAADAINPTPKSSMSVDGHTFKLQGRAVHLSTISTCELDGREPHRAPVRISPCDTVQHNSYLLGAPPQTR